MHPVLFQLPWGGNANAYGTLILIGALVTMPGAWWDARRRGISRGDTTSFIVDYYLGLAIGAFVGGRLLHVLTVPSEYISNPGLILVADGTGFVFFGSLAAIIATWIWLARRHHTEFSVLADLAATWMPLAHGFGRLGCYFAGCCWGAPTTHDMGVEFGPESVVVAVAGAPMVGDHTVPLLPVQAIEAAGLFAIAAWLIVVRVRKGVEPRYRQACRYAIGYGVLRTLTEMMRGDDSRGLIFSVDGGGFAQWLGMAPTTPVLLSWSQLTAICLVALGAWGLRRRQA